MFEEELNNSVISGCGYRLHRLQANRCTGRTGVDMVSANSEPPVELSGQRDWIGILGAMTVDGVEFYCEFEEHIMGELAKIFILILSKGFDGVLIDVFDGVSYFQSSKVTDPSDRDNFKFVRIPPYSPDLNSMQECWRQLKERLRKLFKSQDELEADSRRIHDD